MGTTDVVQLAWNNAKMPNRLATDYTSRIRSGGRVQALSRQISLPHDAEKRDESLKLNIPQRPVMRKPEQLWEDQRRAGQ